MKTNTKLVKRSWVLWLLMCCLLPHRAAADDWVYPIMPNGNENFSLIEFYPQPGEGVGIGRFHVKFPFYHARANHDHRIIDKAVIQYSTDGLYWTDLVKVHHGNGAGDAFQDPGNWYRLVMYQTLNTVGQFKLWTKASNLGGWNQLKSTSNESEQYLYQNCEYFYDNETGKNYALANMSWEFHNNPASNKVYNFRIQGTLLDQNQSGGHTSTSFTWYLNNKENSSSLLSLIDGNPLHKPQVTGNVSISEHGYLSIPFNVPGFTERDDLGTTSIGGYFLESKGFNSVYPNHYSNRPVDFILKKSGNTNVTNGTFTLTKKLTWDQFENGDELHVVSWRPDKYLARLTPGVYNSTVETFQRSDKYILAPYPQVRNASGEVLTGGKIRLKWKVSTRSNATKTDGFSIIWSKGGNIWTEIPNMVAYNKSIEDYALDIDYPEKNADTKDYEFRIKRKDQGWWVFNENIGESRTASAKIVKLNTNNMTIKDISVGNIAKGISVTWTNNLGYSGSNWYYKLIALTNNGSNIRVVNDNIPINSTSVIDSLIIPCIPTQYKLELYEREGTTGTGQLLSNITMTNPVVSLAETTGEISKFSVSKGYYNDRVNISWKVSDDANFTKFTLSRKLRNNPEAAEVELYEIANTKKLYSYEDKDAVLGVYYDYIINAWAECSNKVSLVSSKSSVGFSQPFGVVSGRIAYEGSRPVKGVGVIAEGESLYLNKSILLNTDQKSYVETPYVDGMLSPSEFTFQAWVKPTGEQSGRSLMTAWGKYNINTSGADNKLSFESFSNDKSLSHCRTITDFDLLDGIGKVCLQKDIYQHLSLVYKADENTQTIKISVYLDGKLVAEKTELPYPEGGLGFTLAENTGSFKESANYVYFGRGGQLNWFLNGYIDEVRIWKRTLTTEDISANYDRYISGKENGLALYYRFDESEGKEIFDLSSVNGVYNEHHGIAVGGLNTLRSEHEVPSANQLAIKAVTDANGYFIINTVPYTGDGNSFKITPMLGVHQFEPSNRPLYFSSQSSTHNNIDFTDVSSFNVSGKVIYAGGNYPVEGCQFKVDGKILVTYDGQAVTTDAKGEYSIQVPIGTHELKVEKTGHTFLDGGLALENNQNINFQHTIAGLVFQDITRVKVIGHVVGSKREHEKVSGFGERINNIGADVLTLTAAKSQYLLRTEDNVTPATTDTTFYHNNGEWIKTDGLPQDSTQVNVNGNTLTIHVSPATGEYVAWLYPERYTIENIFVNDGTPEKAMVYERRESLDLSDAPVMDEQMLKTSVRTWTDSVYVGKQGNQLPHFEKFEKTDTVKFHKEWGYFYQAVPSFTLQQMDGENLLNYFGDKSTLLDEDETVAFYTESDGYSFGNPVFTQGKEYKFFLKAFESYENSLPTAPVAEYISPIAGGEVSISAGIATEENPETIALDDKGEGVYQFIGGSPDLTNGIKFFNARIAIDNMLYLPANMANGMNAYVLGGRTTGTDFLTAASDKVDFVLHDPPGSESYAFLEKGSVHTVTETTTIADGVKQDASMMVLLGVDQYILAGVGVLTGGETEQIHKIGVQEELTSKWINGNTKINTSVFTERVSTSPATDFIGHAGDIFVGSGNNMLYGLTNNLAVKKKGELDSSDVVVDGADYVLGRTVNLAMGLTFATRFYYTASELENIMIPKWQQAMESIFVFSADGINAGTITEPVYVSHFPKGHDYFANNAHEDFSDEDKKLTVGCDGNCLKGTSYDIYFPDGFLKKWLDGMDKSKAKQNLDGNIAQIETLAFTDTVTYYRNKIGTWEKLLADNEKAKVDAHYGQNYSFGGGVTIEKSETLESTVTSVKSQTIEASVLAGGQTGFNIFGCGLEVSANAGWVRDEEHTGSSDETETTVTGFVLQEDGALDELTVDFGKDPQHGTFIFRTRGGRTSCPYEGEVRTKFYEPGKYILAEATMRIEVPKINIAGGVNRVQVPAIRPAVFTLNLTNESETKNDGMFRLVVDETTNPDGAILKIDGMPIANGRLFMVPYGEVLTKTLTVEKGPDADTYENIRLLLVSDCQFDLTDLIEDVFDETFVSVEFIPSCTDVNLISPVANWTANTATGDTLAIEVGGYDVNFSNFDHIDLQYRVVGAPEWNTLTAFFADQARYDAAGNISLKEMIPAGANTIKYKWNLKAGDAPDGQYEIRARSICTTPDGVIVSECESAAIAGVKDMSRPMVLGTPSPVDGILNAGGEISILFNEDIQTGMLTKNNFSVSGVLNADRIAEPNVGLAFDGTGKAFTELPIYTNGSFSIETWYQRKPGTAGVLFAYGSGENYLSLGFDATGKAVLGLGNETYTSTATVSNDETWKYIALSYNREANMVSVYGFQGSDPTVRFFESKILSSIPAAHGKLYVGNTSTAATSGWQGAIGRMHFYSVAHTEAEASTVKNEAKAGNEPNLIGYWELTEGSGNTAKDKARSRDLTLNTAWYVYPSGKSVAFDGASQYATIPSSTFPLHYYDDFTIEFRFKAGDQGVATLLSCGPAMYIGFNAGKQLILTTENGVQTLAAVNLLDDQWHHMALSVKRNSAIAVLIDGKLTASFNSSMLSGEIAAANYYLGVKHTGNAAAEYFKGCMDEIRIWRTALTSNAIRLNENNKLRGDEPGLIAYYPFEKYTKQSNGLITVTASSLDMVTNALSCAGTATSSDVSAAMQDCRPIRDIPFEFTASNNKIILDLTAVDYLLEGVTVTATAQGIRDMRNNICDPVTWTAYINRNVLKWGTDGVNLVMAQNELQSFKATISNRGGENIAYYIENIPDWLSLNTPTGNLKPLENKELTFNVFQGVNVGNYEASIVLIGTNGIREVLPVYIKVTGQLPGWSVNPSDFESSMNIIGQIKIEGVYQEDEDDLLGAFIGDVCVGVTSPKYIKSSNTYFTFVDIYGNREHNSKVLTFKLWDASTGRIYPKVEVSVDAIKFAASSIIGSVNDPVIFNTLDVAEQAISLVKGWNWISSNVTNNHPSILNQMKASLSDAGIMIKGRNSYLQQPNWVGNIFDISERSMYLVKTSQSHTLLLEGRLANPITTPITISKGWNWIGYVPSFTLPINNALAGINAQPNDQVKGQSGYAVCVGKDGWIGSLAYMEAGRGYMYYSTDNQSQTLLYPSVSSAQNVSARRVQDKATALNWICTPSEYANSMTITLVVSGNIQGDQVEIAAFCGNECRGSTFLQHIEENEPHPYLGFLMVYGNSGDAISFKVYDHLTKTEYSASALVQQFIADEMYGTPTDPEVVTIETTGIGNMSVDELRIYPNLVKDKLHFRHNLFKLDVVEIVDPSGYLLMRKDNFTAESLDVSHLEQGAYLLRVSIKGEKVVLKFIKQ